MTMFCTVRRGKLYCTWRLNLLRTEVKTFANLSVEYVRIIRTEDEKMRR